MAVENVLQMRFGISRSLAKLLALLAEKEFVTSKMIEEDLRISKDAKVAIHRLRHGMTGTGFVIRSQRGLGYWLDPDQRAWLIDKMKPQELPVGGAGSGGQSAT